MGQSPRATDKTSTLYCSGAKTLTAKHKQNSEWPTWPRRLKRRLECRSVVKRVGWRAVFAIARLSRRHEVFARPRGGAIAFALLALYTETVGRVLPFGIVVAAVAHRAWQQVLGGARTAEHRADLRTLFRSDRHFSSLHSKATSSGRPIRVLRRLLIEDRHVHNHNQAKERSDLLRICRKHTSPRKVARVICNAMLARAAKSKVSWGN